MRIDRITRFLNNTIHQAWLIAFTGISTGIILVHYAGIEIAFGSSLLLLLLNTFRSILKGISRFQFLVFCLCFSAMSASLRYYDEIHGFSGDDVRLIISENRPRLLKFHGYVTDREIMLHEIASESQARIILKTDHVAGYNEASRSRGSILIEARPEDFANIHVGMPVSIYGWLEPLPQAMNPGSFSWASYWQSRQVHALINFRNHASIETHPDEPLSYWRYYIDQIRRRCRDCISSAVEMDRAPLLEALVLGIRESVSQNDRRLFRDSGTLHLLAISGLHLQVIAIFVMWIARCLKCNLFATACLVILSSAFYSLLVGNGASVLRATLMTSVISLSMARNQPGHFWGRMLLAGSIILWLRPSQFFDAGCQLSFLGTAGIQFATESWSHFSRIFKIHSLQHPLERLWSALRKPKFLDAASAEVKSMPSFIIYQLIIIFRISIIGLISLTEAIYISSVVWLFTATLVAFHFSALNPVAIAVNLPLVPATSLALIMSLVGICFSLFGLGLLGRMLIQSAGWLMSICTSILDWSLDRLMPPIAFQSPDLLIVIIFYIFLSLIILVNYSAIIRRLQFTGWLVVIASLLISIVYYQKTSRSRFPEHLEMHVLAVEHGLAIAIRWPDGQNWLYDCGQMGSPAVGERIVAPALAELGIRQIDRLFISHADADHFNGIQGLIASEMKIKSVCTTPHFIRSRQPDATELKNLLAQMQIPLEPLSAGDILMNQESSFARVLHPSPSFTEYRADNSTSLVIEIQANGQNCILTGDLEDQGLFEMQRYFADHLHAAARSAVMIAPHHGGLTSNPDWFYQSFRPEVVISSQARGRFGQAKGLESMIKAISPESRLYITARDGAIAMKWKPEGIVISTFRNYQFDSNTPAGNHLLEIGNARATQALLNSQ